MQDSDDEAAPPGMPKTSEADWFHEVLRLVDKYILQWTEAKQDAITNRPTVKSRSRDDAIRGNMWYRRKKPPHFSTRSPNSTIRWELEGSGMVQPSPS